MSFRERFSALAPEAAPLAVRERLERLGVGTDGLPGGDCPGTSGASGQSRHEKALEGADGAAVVGSGEEAFIRIDRPLAEAGLDLAEWTSLWPAAAILSQDVRVADVAPARTLFLDTETTGLGGAATLVFLIGAVHFQEGRPTLTQFFMPAPAAEPALLEEFVAFLEGFDLLVSYNGRAFDTKVLRDRFVMTRMRRRGRSLEALPHLDLLAPARRIWRLSAPDCRLATLEQVVLRRRRERDIEGWRIPSAYYDYLRGGGTGAMHDVLAHNADDLVSLYLLAAEMLRRVADPAARGGSADEMLGLGTLLVRGGDAEGGRQALQRGAASSSAVNRYLARKRLAQVHKRSGELPSAAALWSAMIEENALSELHPYHELAQYHEHHVRDFTEALRVVERALERLSAGAPDRGRLLHRQRRLRRRLGRGAN